MQLVADVNVVFSALVSKGVPFKVFKENSLAGKYEFASPAFLLSEMEDNWSRLLSSTKLTKEELEEIMSAIKEQVTFIPFSDFSDKLPEAMELNFKDSPYLALALKFDCAIFSGDKGLKKQSKVKVFSPRELLDMLGTN